MAKKSKIARNDQRKVIVERYAAKRLELKKALVDPTGDRRDRARPPASACRSCRATRRRCACATATRSTAARAVSSASSASPVSASATWRTVVSFRASRSRAGSTQIIERDSDSGRGPFRVPGLETRQASPSSRAFPGNRHTGSKTPETWGLLVVSRRFRGHAPENRPRSRHASSGTFTASQQKCTRSEEDTHG